MKTTYGNISQLLEKCFFSVNCYTSEASGSYTTFTADIDGEECRKQWRGVCKPKAVQGLELIAKGHLKRSEIKPENIVSIKRIIYNHYAGYYSYINESENLLQSGVYPVRID